MQTKLRKFHVRVDSVTCDSLNDDLETRSVNMCAIKACTVVQAVV